MAVVTGIVLSQVATLLAVCAAWLVRRSESAVVERGDLARLAASLRS